MHTVAKLTMTNFAITLSV